MLLVLSAIPGLLFEVRYKTYIRIFTPSFYFKELKFGLKITFIISNVMNIGNIEYKIHKIIKLLKINIFSLSEFASLTLLRRNDLV